LVFIRVAAAMEDFESDLALRKIDTAKASTVKTYIFFDDLAC